MDKALFAAMVILCILVIGILGVTGYLDVSGLWRTAQESYNALPPLG